MPANLPPQYYELERQFNKETDLTEKLRLAKELFVLMPKHKGTEKLQAELKAKISKLKTQIEGGAKKHGAHHADPFSYIEKEGAAQIILIGPPNSGKSSILESCTNAKPAVADYPFTTHEPLTGMMMFETVPFQLIDTPPIADEPLPPYLPNLIRQADMAILVCDISDVELPKYLETVAYKLEEKNIILSADFNPSEANPKYAYKKTLLAAHKYSGAEDEYAIKNLQSLYPNFTIVATSIIEDELMNNFKAAIFKALNIIRVYTKRIGHEAEYIDPIILPIGSTVGDAAIMLHKDFAYKLQFAKVWGKGKFEGQKVKNSYALTDEDIVEFHL
jgi:ribosome-interacting GTPase 1